MGNVLSVWQAELISEYLDIVREFGWLSWSIHGELRCVYCAIKGVNLVFQNLIYNLSNGLNVD